MTEGVITIEKDGTVLHDGMKIGTLTFDQPHAASLYVGNYGGDIPEDDDWWGEC